VLVDDKSADETVDIARALPIKVIWHPHNVGYGETRRPPTSTCSRAGPTSS
jgi:glycosyltransferase involved in cell wall biosynthesis